MKNIVITGASRGIGRSCALKLAGKDTTLFLNGRDEKELAKSCQMVKDLGAEARLLIYDLSVPQNVLEMADQIKVDKIDCLIHNAGIAIVQSLEELTLEAWQKTFDVNVTAPYLLTQKLLDKYYDKTTIVNIISIAAQKGFKDWSSYCMSKYALDGFMKSIREELRDKKIRVINLYPGSVATDIWNDLGIEFDKSKMMRPDDIAEAVVMAVNQPQQTVVEEMTLKPI